MKPDLTPTIKICFSGVDNKTEGVFHLKSFTLKFCVYTNVNNRVPFPVNVSLWCFLLSFAKITTVILYYCNVGIVAKARGASPHTHVTSRSRASQNSSAER